MAHDVATGIIEFIMDHFTEESEGTYTCQITDGGGKAQSSLVLIGNGKRGQCLLLSHKTCSIQLHSTKKKKKNNTLWTVIFFLSWLDCSCIKPQMYIKWMCAERTYHNLLFSSVLIRGFAVKPKPGETQTCSRECIEWAFLYDSRLSICCIRDPIMEMY